MTWRAMCGGPYTRYLHVVAMERHSADALGRPLHLDPRFTPA